MDLYYDLVEKWLPFSWAHYIFMKNALLAVLLISPAFALLGTMVVGKHMAFFSDVLGHSALTGVALGVLCGVSDPFWVMLVFVVALALGVNLFKGLTQASSDTILGVFFAMVVALGVVILSKGGGFNKFTAYLIGDILVVTPAQIAALAGLCALVILYWMKYGNDLLLLSVHPVLARSRGVNVVLTEAVFVVILAVVVASAIRLVGILMINSLLILPAAAARVMAGSVRSYTVLSMVISMVSGVVGLIVSYYWGTASGATIVLFCAGFYLAAVFWARVRHTV